METLRFTVTIDLPDEVTCHHAPATLVGEIAKSVDLILWSSCSGPLHTMPKVTVEQAVSPTGPVAPNETTAKPQ